MDTMDTIETTEPSVAPAKPAPAPKHAGEPETEEPVPSVPLRGLADDSMEGLRAAFSGLTVRGPEGKEKEKEKQAVDMGAEEVHPGDGHGPSDEAPFEDTPVESAPSASDFPAVPSPTTTTLPATHPAISSPRNHSTCCRGSRLYWDALPHLWCDSSRDCATYGSCSQRTSGIQLHLQRCA